MKARFLIALVLSAGLALTLAWVAAAQGPEPVAPIPSWDSDMPSTRPLASGDAGAQGATPAVALGQPGLSFRYVQTFGTTEVAYISDTAHINYPYGVGTDGANVWIADSMGLRALKYTNAGEIVQQIGKAGFRYGTGQSLEFVADVAVDSGGNIWLVDSNANHILKFDANGKYLGKLGQSYDSGADNSHLSGPHSITFDGAGNTYVSDSWNQRIQIFQSSGSYLATIGVPGVEGSDNGHFCNPQHIALMSSVLYVADACNHRVQLFNVTNPLAASYLATIGVPGQSGSDSGHFNNPLGVAVDASRIYVADENNHRVQVFDRVTRAYQATISQGWGTGNTQFKNPSDVAVDSAGNIYVADRQNARVQQFNSSLAYVRTYGTTGVPYLTDNNRYNKPSGMAVGPDGSMYLTEERGQRLIKLDAAGQAQWTVGQAGVAGGSSDNTRFNRPTDVALAPSGLIYVADTVNNRIQIFNPDGSYYGTLGAGYGTGDYQFKYPYGLFITPDGTIYVADYDNHRVQIYNSSRVYVATLGETGVPGSDSAHFHSPNDVVVDTRGYIYVSENSNYRVQVFDDSRAFVRTIGVTGVGGSGFDYLNGPFHVGVDARNDLYVASTWSHAIHVFDQNGAYLTTLGNSRGSRSGQLADPHGVALDSDGNLYVADYNNARIQKFAPGVPGWVQTNINGFGERANQSISTMSEFGGQLYAGMMNWGGNGAQLWRTGDGLSWTSVMTNGFGNPSNGAIDYLAEFKGNLYAGTYNWDSAINFPRGGEIWRSGDGVAWSPVITGGLHEPLNIEVFSLAVFSDSLYAGTWIYTPTYGMEVWRSSTGDSEDWTKLASNGFNDDGGNRAVGAFSVFSNSLFAGTYNSATGAEVWRTTDGTDWSQVNADGFGDSGALSVFSMAVFGDHLYAGVAHKVGAGAEIWRCQACDGADWLPVADNGFGNANTRGFRALRVFNGFLYAVVGNTDAGMEVWRSQNGADWLQVGYTGFGDSNNAPPYSGSGVAAFNNRLYIGTQNSANGGEIWKKTVTASFTASPVIGPPPLNVSFANQSAGDVTTTLWDFGDGVTSAAISPTHEYSRTGVYTVTLTVGDGVDSNALTRTALVQVLYRAFLPVVMRN
jgi:sugar lactone lactonase YvrE